MNPWIPHLLRAGGGGGAVLPPAGRTMLANLTSSLILDEGTGGPTWSRATKAWGFNELGYLEEIASGCAFFGGARLVRNTVRTKSEDFSNAAWTKTNCTTPSSNVVVCANATSGQYISQLSGGTSIVVGTRMAYSYRVKRVVGGVDFLQIVPSSATYGSLQFVNISLVDGSYAATGCSATVTAVSADTFDVTIFPTATVTGGDICSVAMINAMTDVRLPSFIGDGVKSFELLRAWSVDVTNYDASYIPEYVSVGVEASPYFGAGIDGAKYFETDWQGAPIAAANLLRVRREASAINNLLYCRDLTQKEWTQTVGGPGAELITADRTFATSTGWSLNLGTGTATISGGTANVASIDGSFVSIFLSPQFTVTIGKTYTIEYDVTATTGTGIRVDFAGVSGPAHTTTGTKRHTITAVTTGALSVVRGGGGASSGSIDNVSCKESAVQCTKATGLDGIANTATTLTATAADAIILQPITLASAARCASAYIKRRTGTGTISFTQDGGSTWTDITSQINSSTWSRVEITATLANPSVGFKISTSGDEIDVDCVQNEAGAVATSPLVTTTATVTRNIDMLSYQSASNIDFTVGTAFARFGSPASAYIGYPISCGNAGRILYGDTTPAIRVYDGTTVISKPTAGFINGGFVKAASSWNSGNSTQKLSVDGSAVVSGAFDGSMGSGAVINIASETSNAQPVYVGPVAIYNYQMTDAELQALTT